MSLKQNLVTQQSSLIYVAIVQSSKFTAGRPVRRALFPTILAEPASSTQTLSRDVVTEGTVLTDALFLTVYSVSVIRACCQWQNKMADTESRQPKKA